MLGGRFPIYLRSGVFALSLACLVAAAGMMIVCLAKQVQETDRRNAEKAAAANNATPQRGGIERDGPLTISSLRQSANHGLRFYDGDVRIDLPGMSVQCQHVQREADRPDRSIRLAGYGGVAIRGVACFPRLQADNFVFDSGDGGRLTLAGEVRVEGPDGPRKYRLCRIALDGRMVLARSLLDDLAASQTLARKFALLEDISVVYGDDELPPEATWLLAMKLLEHRLTWRSMPMEKSGQSKTDGGLGGHRRQAADSAARFDPAAWPEAHSGEPWMREGAAVAYWRLAERRHVDVLRAVKLLRRPGADAADNERRQRWLAEIERNNTLLRMVVEPVYRPHAVAGVTLNARNADRLTLKLYRVGNGAAWAAVRQRQGRDFIYADAAAHFAALTETTAAGPKRLGELMENLVTQWAVEASKLPWSDDWALKCPGPGPGSSWYANREFTIAAETLAKPGYYVLAAEANGETAFAPVRVEEGK